MIWLLPARSIERGDRTWASGYIPHSISLGDVMSKEWNEPVQIDFSRFLDGSGADMHWCCYRSKCSPLAGREHGRNNYAAWLGSEQASQKGLYIWLHALKDNNNERFRFIHVGLSKRGKSTLASRTRAHCRNAFTNDPTYELRVQHNAFGSLTKVGHHPERGINPVCAQTFLDQIRVLLLIQPNPDLDAIAKMEGLIAYAAALALGADQITNTMGRVKAPQECDKLWGLVKRLNAIVPMLPEI